MQWADLKPFCLVWGETYQLTVRGGVIQGNYTGDYSMWQLPFVARQFTQVRVLRDDDGSLQSIVNRYGVVHLCNYAFVGFPCTPEALDPIVKNTETGEYSELLQPPLSRMKARMLLERAQRDRVLTILTRGAQQPKCALYLLPDDLIAPWFEPYLQTEVGPIPE